MKQKVAWNKNRKWPEAVKKRIRDRVPTLQVGTQMGISISPQKPLS